MRLQLMCAVASTDPFETSLFTIGRLADSWTLYDNTAAMPKIIASEERGQLQVGETTLYNDLVGRYGKP